MEAATASVEFCLQHRPLVHLIWCSASSAVLEAKASATCYELIRTRHRQGAHHKLIHLIIHLLSLARHLGRGTTDAAKHWYCAALKSLICRF
jgi:hypothetical protein